MTVIELDEWRELEEELNKYADLEGTELGEYCARLADFSSYTYCMNSSFAKALIDEIRAQLWNFKKHSKIVEISVTPVPYIAKSLEWNDES